MLWMDRMSPGGIRVEECLVESTDNATISAALSHIVPSWEPLFAIVLQAHNCAELSVNLVHFSQSGHLRQRGVFVQLFTNCTKHWIMVTYCVCTYRVLVGIN